MQDFELKPIFVHGTLSALTGAGLGSHLILEGPTQTAKKKTRDFAGQMF
jgi:hypothetical protein